MKGVIPCALHAWGSQTTPCPCGCRATGLAPSRLASRGLYGVLAAVPDNDAMPDVGRSYRHLHPREAALLCGPDPGLKMNVHMRLASGAVGQLASLLQSFWIMLQVQQSLQMVKCGQITVGLTKSFHLCRSWWLARAGKIWGEQGVQFWATPSLEQALLWKPVQDATIQQLVTPDRSIEQCLEQADCIIAELAVQSDDTGVAEHGLTVTQVAIPWQSEDESDDDTCEHASADATTCAPNSDSEDQHHVVPPLTPEDGMCVVTIHWIGGPMSMFEFQQVHQWLM